MQKLEIKISSIGELAGAVKQILRFSGGNKVFAFYGEMGSGKTIFIKEFCRQLGSNDNFSSPTYSIVNEYSSHGSSNFSKIYHIDLYRIKNLQEALEAGVEEYLNSGCFCFIEWAELIESLLPSGFVKIHIKPDGNIRNLVIFSG